MCLTYPHPPKVSFSLSERENSVLCFLGGGREGAETGTAHHLADEHN